MKEDDTCSQDPQFWGYFGAGLLLEELYL